MADFKTYYRREDKSLANSPQARKRARQAVGRRALNSSHRSMVRTYIKKVIAAIAANDKPAAEAAFKAAEPIIDRMTSKGIFTKNKAARHKHRLTKQIKEIAA